MIVVSSFIVVEYGHLQDTTRLQGGEYQCASNLCFVLKLLESKGNGYPISYRSVFIEQHVNCLILSGHSKFWHHQGLFGGPSKKITLLSLRASTHTMTCSGNISGNPMGIPLLMALPQL